MLTFSIVGGYLTALIAKKNHWKNVLWVAGLTLIYLLSNVSRIPEGETFFFIIAIVLMLGGIAVGAKFFMKKLKT